MFKHIVVPLDGSVLAECVLPHAVAVATAFEAQITLVRVVEHVTMVDFQKPLDPLDWQVRRAEAKDYLDTVSERLAAADLVADCVVLEGEAAFMITEYIHQNNIDLIILSSHGKSGLSSWNVSSVVQKIIARAQASLVLVRAYTGWNGDVKTLRYRRILVTLDGSRRAEYALQPATQLASRHNASLVLAHVVRKPEIPRRAPLSPEESELAERLTKFNQDEAQRYLEELQGRVPGQVETRLLVSEDVAVTLHGLVDQEQVDLVVMSAHGYSGRSNWPYGSLTTSFIDHGITPLLFVQDLAPGELQPGRAELAVRERKGH